MVSNVIFETLILNYFTSVRATDALINSEYIEKTQYIQDGRLNMEKIIRKFASEGRWLICRTAGTTSGCFFNTLQNVLSVLQEYSMIKE